MRLRSTILIGVLALIAVVVGATVVSLTVVLERNARERLGEDLARSREVFTEVQRYRQTLARSECATLAEDSRLKATVQTADRRTVLTEALDLAKTHAVDLLLVTDGEGTLLVDTTEPTASGNNLAKDPIVGKALAESEIAGIWQRGPTVFQVQARRMAFGDAVVGVLVIGYKIDARLVEAVKRQTSSNAVIEAGSQMVTMSSIDGDPPSSGVSAAIQSVVTGERTPREIQLAGTTYLALAAELPGQKGAAQPLRYTVFQSLDKALDASRALARIIYGIAFAALIAAILFAVTLSRRLSKPLDQLVDFAQQIAAGKLDARTVVEGSVEVRDLGTAMNRMAADLRASQDVLADRTRLEGEIDIARRIQTSILPPVTTARNLEIAARMIPASEVGGDYYDVRPAEDGCWIGVGDVAGHGLPAGIVMLMVQSAVATMTKSQEGSPAALLGILNDVVYDNIHHRMLQNEYVTFTLIRYHEDGRLIFAGAHEELVLLRKAADKCESLDTPGTWVGATSEIRAVTRDTSARLEVGDLLVVYTDGITEAENGSGEPFGIERMCKEIESSREQPVTSIRDHVLATAQAWSPTQVDDMTLVVMRYAGPPA
jgi:phosphoserine phosphatase RsbU/P